MVSDLHEQRGADRQGQVGGPGGAGNELLAEAGPGVDLEQRFGQFRSGDGGGDPVAQQLGAGG